MAYYNKGYYKRAIGDYDRAIELNPYYYDAYNNRAMAWYDLGEFEKSIDDCTKAIELDTKFTDAYNNRGNAWYHLEDFELARYDFEKVAKSTGFESIGYSNLGDVNASLGDFLKALEYYKIADSYENKPEWLSEVIDHKLERIDERIGLMRSNVPREDIVQSIKLEDKIVRSIDKIRKIARSDTKSVVHYTKIFVADIYVGSLNSRMHYSNAIYMNDPMEGRVFFEYLNDEEIKQAYLKGEERNESSVYLGSFLPAEDAGTGKSFEDELVMWRTYGKDESGKEAAGCNIVLSSEFLDRKSVV